MLPTNATSGGCRLLFEKRPWTQSISLVKIAYFSGFKHSSKHLGYVCTQVSKIYNTVLVAFVYLNKKILHIVPLIRFSRFVMLALTKKKSK